LWCHKSQKYCDPHEVACLAYEPEDWAVTDVEGGYEDGGF